MMEIDKEQFPDDATGDALRRLRVGGDSLSAARNVDFSVVFSTRHGAEEFCRDREISRISPERHIEEHDGVHDVTLGIHMVPGYDAITAIEDLIEKIAAPLGGENDGWGCFSIEDGR